MSRSGDKRGRSGYVSQRDVPAKISAHDFSAARTREIRAIAAELTSTGTRRVMQTLPHFLQRRQMTFAPKKYPRRLLDAAKREFLTVNVSHKPRAHRKFRRRPQYIAQNFGRRQQDKKWLPTHTWHAKRFKMVRLWGYVLPKRPSDRGSRSAIKSVIRQSVVLDNSVEHCLLVTGQQTVMWQLLTLHVERWGSGLKEGGRVGRTLLFDGEERLICPVTFVWRPQTQDAAVRQALVWVHASALESAQARFLEVLGESGSVESPALARFDLMGPEAHQVLNRVCRTAAPDSYWEQLRGNGTPAQFLSDLVLHEVVRDPRLAVALREKAIDAVRDSSAASMSAMLRMTTAPVAVESLWQQQFPACANQATLDLRRGVVRRPNENDKAPSCPVIIFQNPGLDDRGSLGLGAGFSLIVPETFARPFWHAMQMANAHSIGLQDWIRIHHQELGRPYFPVDFPDTPAGQAFAQLHATNMLVKHSKIAKGKTVKFSKIDSEWPPFLAALPEAKFKGAPVIHWGKFSFDLPDAALVPVCIAAPSRGTIRFNNPILEPLAEESTPLAKHVGAQEAGVSLSNGIEAELELWRNGGCVKRHANRKHVGFALGGGVSLKRGKGYGIGIVTVAFLKKHRHLKQVPVIMRNVHAVDVFKALIWPKNQ